MLHITNPATKVKSMVNKKDWSQTMGQMQTTMAQKQQKSKSQNPYTWKNKHQNGNKR